MPDSTTAGYVAPIASDTYDAPLDDSLQVAIVGIVGIGAQLVRPRWQAKPPQQPEYDVNWCAFGCQDVEVDPFAYHAEVEDADGGHQVVARDELLHYLFSFYGPGAAANCERWRDGLELAQNRDALSAVNVGLVEVGKAMRVPALLTNTWVARVDVDVTFRRRTHRTYPIRTITSTSFGLDNEHYTTPIDTGAPP